MPFPSHPLRLDDSNYNNCDSNFKLVMTPLTAMGEGGYRELKPCPRHNKNLDNRIHMRREVLTAVNMNNALSKTYQTT
jgi:hypothetical protein